MDKGSDLNNYNRFCSNLTEGSILYNLDFTNLWGEYLLVVDITAVKIEGHKTYTVLLLGLKKDGGNLIPRNLRIKMTPEYVCHIPFLKYVGRCIYNLKPEISDVKINTGLIAVLGQTNLHKYATILSVSKPRKHKYGKDGKPIIKSTSSK